MRKSLLLLALSLQTNVSCSDPQERVHGANIETNTETLVETPYKHPEDREVGDFMPRPLGRKVSHKHMYNLDKKTGIIKETGLIIGYDRDGDKIPEYEFVGRFCDFHRDVKTYAVYDVPHKKLYIDYSRNRYIDSIEDIDSLEDVWTKIPMKCGKEISV